MKENKIEELAVVVLDSDNFPVAPPTKSTGAKISNAKAGKGRKKVDEELLLTARSLYITTEMSIPAVAKQVGINESTLYEYSRKEKWNLLKVNPDEVDRNRALADEIYATINFMDDAKKILHQLLNQKEYQTPKDVKILVEAFRMADDRTTQLRLIRENVKGDGYYGEDQ